MDPITQGALGAVASQAVFGKTLPKSAWLIGLASGMAADLDVLIPVGSDVTAGWIYHRGFTHALAFVPIGALIASLVFLPWRVYRGKRWAVFGAAFIAYLTHAPLDALTSYGTQLFWPISDYRVALDWMPIVDLVFTPILLIGLIVAAVKQKRWPAMVSLALAGLYVSLGIIQHARATQAMTALAASRGHEVERYRVQPSPGSLFVWRGLYRADDTFYVDGIRTGLFDGITVEPGESVEAIDSLSELPGANEDDPTLQRQFTVFRWFADGYLASPDGAPRGAVGDMRYSMDPARMLPIWGVDFSTTPATRWEPERSGRSIGKLWETMWGNNEAYIPLESVRTE